MSALKSAVDVSVMAMAVGTKTQDAEVSSKRLSSFHSAVQCYSNFISAYTSVVRKFFCKCSFIGI